MRSNAAAAVALTGLALLGCQERGPAGPEQASISYAVSEPGSLATPTHPSSLALVSAQGPDRFVALQQFIKDAGKPCNVVTGGVLKGGLQGTDEWRVKCADSGDWSIWFHPGRPPEVMGCSAGDCLDYATPVENAEGH